MVSSCLGWVASGSLLVMQPASLKHIENCSLIRRSSLTYLCSYITTTSIFHIISI